LADVCYRIGILHLENDDWEAAERNLVMATESFQQLLPQASRNRSIQASGLSCLLQLVDVQLELQEYDQAVSGLTAAITDSRQVQRDGDPVLPTNFYYRKNLYLYLALAIAHKESGNFIEAIRAKQKALDFAVQPVRRNRQAPLRRMQTY
jgi:tetratricopeptide (TPR) repeat protein